MRFMVRSQEDRGLDYGLIYGAISVVALAAGRFLPLEKMTPVCFFHAVSGLACPTCGVTRSLVLLAHGNLRKALSMNPLFATIFVLALIYFFYCIIRRILLFPRVKPLVTSAEERLIIVFVWVLFAANWAYLTIYL